MCGIAGIISKKTPPFNLLDLTHQMSVSMSHRGPDGEGLIAISDNLVTPLKTNDSPLNFSKQLPFLPQKHFKEFNTSYKAAFAHRRLAIIDLKETGHQPMSNHSESVWITYNGEIYNYVELKHELKQKGYTFYTDSDTEVLINAYLEWGTRCVEKFNGMWAFCLYDVNKEIYFASRDKLGVKPFYYMDTKEYIAFASEQKAFIKSGLLKASYNETALQNYLVNDLLENESANFFEGVTELMPGHSIVFKGDDSTVTQYQYFQPHELLSHKNDHLSDQELISNIHDVLEKAIQIRLRSDVEVGTCLSGGIDSSAIAGIMGKFNKRPIHCFTSVFSQGTINEEVYANEVCRHINGIHSKVEPTISEFKSDVNELIYALDSPIWDTSTYAQFRVMKLAKEKNIKVVLDGQGADELFAGYHHHFLAYWNQLANETGYVNALSQIKKSKITIPEPYIFYLKSKLKKSIPKLGKSHLLLISPEFSTMHKAYIPANDLNMELINDMGAVRLKSFLRCEDRCGMWNSVESRTPFSDDTTLMQLLFSFDGKRKIKNGVSKYLLREAAKDVLPAKIYKRYDKVGFETPMNKWIETLKPEMEETIESAGFNFVNQSILTSGNYLNNTQSNKLFFKLFVLAKWQEVFKS